MGSLKISFIIANYNTSDLTIKLVKSIFKHCDFSKKDKEIIIVDDCSKLSEQRKIHELCSEEFMSYTFLGKNMGIGSAMNHGIKEASGKYIIRFDNDVELIQDNFDDKLIKFLEDEKELGLVTCMTDNIGSPSQKFMIPDPFKGDIKKTLEFVESIKPISIAYHDAPQGAFAGFCMAFRKSEVGLFNTDSKMYGEDNLKYLEYLKKGMKCGVAQRLFVLHDYHGTTRHIPQAEIDEASRIAKDNFIKAVEDL